MVRLNPKNRAIVWQACRSSSAFTLVEATVVMCILALVASGSMLMLSGPLRKSHFQAMAADVVALDQWSRVHSREHSVQVELDLDRQRILAVAESGEQKELVMPSDIVVKKIILKANVIESGIVRMPFRSGRCGTYALLLSPARRQSTWYVFSGPTGQQYSLVHNEQIDKDLPAWFAQWTHTR